MSSILDELELNGKKAQLASFTPQHLNSLRRSGKEIDQIKDLNKTLLIEWNGILLDKYDGRALLAPEELTPSRSDSRQQKSNEKYEEDLCDIYRYEDFMNILGDSYMTPNQDPGARSGSVTATEGNLKSVGWCYSNDNKDDNNSENNNMDASEKSSTEVPTKQEPIQSSPDQKELIFKEFRELSTNLNEAMANQADITEKMLRSLVENGDLTLVTQQLKAVNEFIIKLNGKLKEHKETTIIKWRPSIEVPLGMQIVSEKTNFFRCHRSNSTKILKIAPSTIIGRLIVKKAFINEFLFSPRMKRKTKLLNGRHSFSKQRTKNRLKSSKRHRLATKN